MNNMLLSSGITAVVGFLCNKFLPGSAIWAVPAVSALAGIFLKQTPKDGAVSGLMGGGVLGGLASLLGDGGVGSILGAVMGDSANGVLGNILGGGILGGAGGGIGGFLQGMLNKSKAA